MTMKVNIEKAMPCHKTEIMRLLKQANMHYIPSEEMPGLTYQNYYVALVDGHVAGFCGYKIIDEKEAKTELMVVDIKYRGRGIGYMLQVFRMKKMLESGIRILTTNTDLPESVRWYKKHFGYVVYGTLEKIHEFGSPEIKQWTVLKVDLQKWHKKQKEGEIV